MRFNFSTRVCQFGTFNNRNEFDGPEARVKAIDLPMTFSVRHNELDMLIPAEDDGGPAFSEFLFREKHLRAFVLSPLKIYRKPEDIHLTIIYGTSGARAKEYELEFKDVTIKDPVLNISIEDGKMTLTCKAQIHPGRHLQAIVDNVEMQACRFKCKSVQEELLDKDRTDDDDEGGDEGGDAGAQAELPGTQPAQPRRPRVPDDDSDLGPALPGEGEVDDDDEDDDDDE